MNKNDILENKIIEIENENSDTKGKIVRDAFIALGIGGSLVLLGHGLGTLFTPLSYPLFSLATIIPSIITYDIAVRNNLLKENNKQINHLNKVGKKGIKKTDKLDRARVKRIEELKSNQENKIKKDKILSFLSAIPTASWFISSALSLIIPEAFIINLASVGILSGIMIASNKTEKEILELDTRITNLENDLLLEPVFGYEPQTKTNQTIKSDDRKKSSKVEGKTSTRNESLIERYLKDLEKEENKAKVLKKGK